MSTRNQHPNQHQHELEHVSKNPQSITFKTDEPHKAFKQYWLFVSIKSDGLNSMKITATFPNQKDKKIKKYKT